MPVGMWMTSPVLIGILGRSAVVTNHTKQPLTIEQAAAASWNLPSGADYNLRYLSGHWAAEDNLSQQKILLVKGCWKAVEALSGRLLLTQLCEAREQDQPVLGDPPVIHTAVNPGERTLVTVTWALVPVGSTNWSL
jgi:hypothetical protein